MRRCLTVVMAGVLLVISAIPVLAHDDAGSSQPDPQVSRDLAEVRAATAKYHEIDVAIADGYIAAGHCLEVPGQGAMGIHFVNFAYAFDAVIDPLKPEVLLYEETPSGMRLVGVEYVVASALVDETPSVFGQPFDGPMAGHEPGQPEHYDLHVWIWKHNPNGMFAQFNPMVECGA